jgi:hypothetical protein
MNVSFDWMQNGHRYYIVHFDCPPIFYNYTDCDETKYGVPDFVHKPDQIETKNNFPWTDYHPEEKGRYHHVEGIKKGDSCTLVTNFDADNKFSDTPLSYSKEDAKKGVTDEQHTAVSQTPERRNLFTCEQLNSEGNCILNYALEFSLEPHTEYDEESCSY